MTDPLPTDPRCECAARYGRPWHRSDCPAKPATEGLIDGFYQQQRDALQDENRQLRDRIKVLEEKIKRAEWAARGVLAELT